jgi:CHAT domain-containing protein
LLWIFTGTPELFNTKPGVAGLEPLYDRIQFLAPGGFASPRQPQLELKSFDAQRLKEVALKLREIYPTANKTALVTKVTSEFIERLVAKVTAGFKGDVGVVPRQFLRQFVNVLDLVADVPPYEHPYYWASFIVTGKLNP